MEELIERKMYIVIAAHTTEELEARVNKKVKEGYYVNGNITHAKLSDENVIIQQMLYRGF